MKLFLKLRNQIINIIIMWGMSAAVVVLIMCLFGKIIYKNIDLFIYSLFGILCVLIMYSCYVIIVRLKTNKMYEKEEIFQSLQSYIYSINEKVTFIIEKDKEKNGQALIGKYIILTDKWYEHAKENGPAYAKATVCHELYHIKENKAFFEWKNFNLLNPIKKFRDKEYIREWLEEFRADRYGCELLGNKDDFLGHMYVMQKQRKTADAKKLKKRKKALSDHPTWEMRIRFIEQDIEPTIERVTEEFYEYYKK